MPLRVWTWDRSDSTKDGPTFWSESECERGIDVTTATTTTQNLAQPFWSETLELTEQYHLPNTGKP